MNDIYEDKAEWKAIFAAQSFFHRYKYVILNGIRKIKGTIMLHNAPFS